MKTHRDQLLLDFGKSCDDLRHALDRFGLAAQRLVQEPEQQEAPPETSEVETEVKAIRARIRRLVGVIVDQAKIDHHAAWVMLYHAHFKRTGFHAVHASGGRGTHLDAAERENQLPGLLETARHILITA